MNIIYNKKFPFKKLPIINVFGTLFVRSGTIITDYDMNHERIHSKQMKELLYIPFYFFYFIEWVSKLPFHLSNSYKNISFEREAYKNMYDMSYLRKRKKFSNLKYLFKQ